MKRIQIFLAVLIFPATGISKDVPRDLILVAGQSNAVGFDVDPAKLPKNETDRQVMFWWRCGDPPPDTYDCRSQDWEVLQIQPRNEPMAGNGKDRQYGNFKDKAGGFGPEIGLARRLMEQQNRPLAIVKVAFSGTGISDDWNPNTGSCYRALIEETRKATTAAQASGTDLRLRALVWVQGESDASPEKAAAYEKNLKDLIKSLRKDLAAPHLIVLAGVNTRFQDGKEVLKVVAAQKALARHMADYMYVDTSGATIANPAHFDTAGTLDVGQRFADALMKMESASKKGGK